VFSSSKYFFTIILLLVLVSCETDSSPTAVAVDPGPSYDSLTVDASSDWGFVKSADGKLSPVAVSDRTSSSDWVMGFFATSAMLNGGAAGPGSVDGYCLCQNSSATDTEVMAMTSDSELQKFEDVKVTDIPSADSLWASDSLEPVIKDWYSYNFQTHAISAAPEKVWKMRTAAGDAYAKFHVTQIANGTQQHAGTITFKYALQTAAGATFQVDATGSVDVSSGGVYFDLDTGSAVTSADSWDLHFEGYSIRVNGGVSGGGQAGASLATDDFDSITDASDLSSYGYPGDAFAGTFTANKWYRYNLAGGHQIWPVFNVYLVRSGNDVYKIQLTGYYSAGGDSRHISFRYEKLS